MSDTDLEKLDDSPEIIDEPSEIEVEIDSDNDNKEGSERNTSTNVSDVEEDLDARRLKRKSANQLRQQKQRATRQRKNEELEELRSLTTQQANRLRSLEQNQLQLNGMAGQYQREQLEKEMNESSRLMSYYKQQLAEAVNTNDGVAFAKIQAAYDVENEKIFKLKQTQVQLQNTPVPPAIDPQTLYFYDQRDKLVQDFKRRHDWYNNSQYREETALANRLDKEIADEGYRAHTKAYWNELDKRLKEEVGYLFEDNEGNSYDKPHQQNSTSPRNVVGGSSSVSSTSGTTSPNADGKVKLKFKAMHIDTLKHQGIMDENGKILDKKRALYYHNTWNKRS